MFDINNVIEIFNNYSSIAIPISLVISTLIALLGIVPSVFVTGANIIFFGPLMGFFISLLGETIGAYITFIVYRLGFKKNVEKLSGRHKLLSDIVNAQGKKVAFLIFEGRLLPFIPSGFVTLAASISNVNWKPFLLATLIGKIPSIALEALVSYDLINIQSNWIRLVITVGALVLIFITLNKKKSN